MANTEDKINRCPDEETLTVEEACLLARMSRSTLFRLRKAGRLPTVRPDPNKPGVRIPLKAFQEFLREYDER